MPFSFIATILPSTKDKVVLFNQLLVPWRTYSLQRLIGRNLF
jgi:hypothetical protein